MKKLLFLALLTAAGLMSSIGYAQDAGNEQIKILNYTTTSMFSTAPDASKASCDIAGSVETKMVASLGNNGKCFDCDLLTHICLEIG